MVPPPPPQKTVLMSFDCSFSLGASLPFHHALTIIISAFLDLSDGREGSRCHRFKFFGFCDGILSFLGRVCVAVMAPTIVALSFCDGASKFFLCLSINRPRKFINLMEEINKGLLQVFGLNDGSHQQIDYYQ